MGVLTKIRTGFYTFIRSLWHGLRCIALYAWSVFTFFWVLFPEQLNKTSARQEWRDSQEVATYIRLLQDPSASSDNKATARQQCQEKYAEILEHHVDWDQFTILQAIIVILAIPVIFFHKDYLEPRMENKTLQSACYATGELFKVIVPLVTLASYKKPAYSTQIIMQIITGIGAIFEITTLVVMEKSKIKIVNEYFALAIVFKIMHEAGKFVCTFFLILSVIQTGLPTGTRMTRVLGSLRKGFGGSNSLAFIPVEEAIWVQDVLLSFAENSNQFGSSSSV